MLKLEKSKNIMFFGSAEALLHQHNEPLKWRILFEASVSDTGRVKDRQK